MSDPDRAREPSMEEILASIRRIVSDDGHGSRPAADEAPEGDDVSDRPEPAEYRYGAAQGQPAGHPGEDEEMGAAEAEHDAPALSGIADLSGPGDETEEEPFEPSPVAETSFEAGPVAGRGARGFTEPQKEATAPAFGLPSPGEGEAEPRGRAVFRRDEPGAPAENSRLLSARADESVASAFASLENFVLSTHSRNLEEVVSETLQPLLRGWLDANLPPLVERLVREEIERVSRGRR